MKTSITVVPSDNYIIVNGMVLSFTFDAPQNLHALQWCNGSGHIEYTDDQPNMPLSADDYEKEVLPFVILWETEKARLNAEAAEAEAVRLAEYNSPEARGIRIRAERDRRLTASDRYALPDYPHADAATRQAWLAYRQALRNVPEQEGFPWTGPEDSAVPWPVEPA
ncbi:tail fiber assembly protein [Desulfocurvibacter africanus]|uniref:tail fiber assembly protein n=1 Tax=Desulfocurvibacter africanus TaxID=873 RepID=UPI002FD8F05C